MDFFAAMGELRAMWDKTRVTYGDFSDRMNVQNEIHRSFEASRIFPSEEGMCTESLTFCECLSVAGGKPEIPPLLYTDQWGDEKSVPTNMAEVTK